MHVFIDTNILLSFYHFTGDDLDALNSVFISHKKGTVKVHLTDQVMDEFHRNREAKIGDALKRFKGFLLPQLPYFMKSYPEYEKLQKMMRAVRAKHAALLKRAEEDIINGELAADHLIGGIFEKYKVIKTTRTLYSEARLRVDIGNPPGKNGSLGDAINWLQLLQNVPEKQDLYIVTDDSDYYSPFDEKEVNGFLRNEWQSKKKSEIKCYRTLADFFKDHYDGVVLSFDPEKKSLIDELESTRSFAGTHAVIAELDKFKYFSLQEAVSLLDAAIANSQFGWIISDEDVKDVMSRAVLPHKSKIKGNKYRELIEEIEKDD